MYFSLEVKTMTNVTCHTLIVSVEIVKLLSAANQKPFFLAD